MLIEVKVKVARVIDSKTRKRTETFLLDRELFTQAEYAVMTGLSQEMELGTVESFEIQSLRISPIKEVAEQFISELAINTYIATLRDIWLADDGTEKQLKYKVLLWAEDLTAANNNAHRLAREGYDMQIEGIKQVDYEYLGLESNQEEEAENE